MIVVFIAAFFCVLNISLWGVFFIKFKKIFSTDDIIASTREQMDRMIADINHNAGRNIELIEDRIKQLKAVVAEADRHVELAKRELESQRAALSYQNKIDSAMQAKKHATASFKGGASGRAAQQYMRNQPQNISAALQAGYQYELTAEGSRQVKSSHVEQGDLFEQAESDDSRQIVSDSGTMFRVESDGSSYAAVPVIGGNVTYADEPVYPKQSFAQLVKDLHFAGHSVEEIARNLGSSTTEVQLVLDMNS